MSQGRPTSSFGQLGRSRRGRFVIAIVLAVFALITYFSSSSFNEITNETQYLSITEEQARAAVHQHVRIVRGASSGGLILPR